MNAKAKATQAKATWEKAVSELDTAEEALRKHVREIEAKQREALDAEVKAEIVDVIALRAKVNVLRAAWDDALVEVKRGEKRDDGLHVGSPVVEWTNASYGYRAGPWRKTGRLGVVDIWTRESQHPENELYGLPSVGDFYIRVLKKDGSKSIRYTTLNDWRTKWLPEGQEPKAAR